MKDMIEKMSMDSFFRLCNRLVTEMGFKVRNSVYRDNVVVFDAYMPLPGRSLHYVIILIRKPTVTKREILEMIDVETVEVRWMIITTGKFEDLGDLKNYEDLTFMEWQDFERLLIEFGLKEELTRLDRGKEAREGRYLPSAGELESMLQWARQFLESQNYEKALEYVNNALRIKETPEAKKLKSKILHKMERTEKAISLLTSVLDENIRDDEAWMILGEVLESIDDVEEAEQAYSQCVRFNPRNISCWINRGNVMLSLEKYQEAMVCYEKALEIRQDLPEIWNNRGVALKYMGKYDEALKSYNMALKFDKNFANAYLNKAYLYFDLKKYEEARNAIEDYLKLREDTAGLILLARIYLKRNLKKEAKNVLQRILEIEPGNQEAKELLDKLEGKRREVKEYEKVRKLLLEEYNSLQEKYGKMNDGTSAMLRNIKNKLERGELAQAFKEIEDLKSNLYKQEMERVREVLYKNTKRLLELAEGEAPEGLEDLSYKELDILGEEAIKKFAFKENEKGDENIYGSSKGFIHILYEDNKWESLKKIDDEYAYNALGLRYMQARKYTMAIEQFKRAWNKNKTFKEAEFNLAYALFKKGEIRKAKALLRHLGYEEFLELWNEK